MAAISLRQDILTEAYSDLSEQLSKVINQHCRRIGARGHDREDLAQEARLQWLRAIDTLDESRSSAATWTTNKARLHLLELYRRYRAKVNRMSQTTLDPSLCGTRSQSDFHLEDFAFDLSDDAKTIVALIFAEPIDFRAYLVNTKGGDRFAYRMAIRDFMKDCGWTFARVSQCFEEIEEAIAVS